MKRVVVKQSDPAKPMPVEVLAESIKAIADGTKRLLAGPLKRDTVALLIQRAAPGGSSLTLRDVKAVLDGIENLAREHLK